MLGDRDFLRGGRLEPKFPLLINILGVAPFYILVHIPPMKFRFTHVELFNGDVKPVLSKIIPR